MADELDRTIWRGFWAAGGRAPEPRDYAAWRTYWPDLEARGRELNQPSYAWERLIGRGAGGADLPKYGPYASPPSELHDVPPFPGDEPQQPPAPPEPPASGEPPDPGATPPEPPAPPEPPDLLGKPEEGLVAIAGEVLDQLAAIDVRLSDQNEQLRSIADSLRRIAQKY